MPNLIKEIIAERLKETFGDETQQITASRLTFEQATVNKWLHGKSLSFDALVRVSKEYNVSVDWLMGLSPNKKRDSVTPDSLTYEQLFSVLDILFQKHCAIHPDMAIFGDNPPDDEPQGSPDNPVFREPKINTDVIMIKDKIIAKALRTRNVVNQLGGDYLETWRNGNRMYEGLPLLNCSEKMEEALALSQTATLASDSGWAELVRKLSGMTEEDLDDYIAKKKGEKQNG